MENRILKKTISRILLLVITTILILVLGLIAATGIFLYGPSRSAKNLFVSSVLETSALGFLATWFLPPEQIDFILETNKVEEIQDITNPDLVTINSSDTPKSDSEAIASDIELIEISGMTYKGRLMIVKDPSRVKVGLCTNFGNSGLRGDHLPTIAENYNAIAAINGGGFEDEGGVGTGSIPTGFVFSNGEYRYGSLDQSGLLIGFDSNDKLIVGNMTGEQAKSYGIRDALTFGPALIVNGEAAQISGNSSGLNPRTAIGQREDGSVLLLVIDGRQANSLGASYSDLIEIMKEYGAVNAANLDGGSSSLMYYDGEIISHKSSFTGDRAMPTCFYVERISDDN